MGELSPGLRRVANGFKASEGYNLRDLKAGLWTSAMKRRVSMYQAELNQMTAQKKIIVRTRSPDRLKKAQAVGGHNPKYKFKVAFLPGSGEAEIIWNKDNTPTVKEKGYSRKPGLFDREQLVIAPRAEIARVLNLPQMRDAQRILIQAGPNVMFGDISTRKGITAKVLMLQNQYDGIKPLPESSGNKKRHDNRPEAHHFSEWLIGLQGFHFRRDPDKVKPKQFQSIIDANTALRLERAKARRRAKYARKHKRKK